MGDVIQMNPTPTFSVDSKPGSMDPNAVYGELAQYLDWSSTVNLAANQYLPTNDFTVVNGTMKEIIQRNTGPLIIAGAILVGLLLFSGGRRY